MSIYEAVFENNGNWQDRVALKTKSRSIFYREIPEMVRNIAQLLLAMGFGSGQKILILLPNCAEFIISFFAAGYAGGIAVLADTKLNKELAGIIGENNIRFIITDTDGKNKIDALMSSHDQFAEEYSNGIKMISAEEISDGFERNNTDIEKEKADDDQEAMILYTSGSTGKPKGVINTHGTLKMALGNYMETFRILQEDKLLAVAPFFHSYAFGSCMLAGLASGACLVIMDSFRPREVLKTISNEKITVFHGVPYMYSLLGKYFDSTRFDLASLRFCISAGAPLTREVSGVFTQISGRIVHQEYGSSETGTISLNCNDDPELGLKSVGRLLKNVEARICTGAEEEAGEIYIKSPGCSIGYVGEKPFERDWFDTGDIGKIDEAGYLHILGRKKNMINIAGNKVNPDEIEQLLLNYKGVEDVLVRGMNHDVFGEVIEALVVRKDENLSKLELMVFCQKHLSFYKAPRLIQWVDSIPRTSLGKKKCEN